MLPQHVPSIGRRYWVSLCIASILGCNTGDEYAHIFGFIDGLPILALLFAVIIYFEQRDAQPRQIYYWLAIVVVRTAATNLADFTAHTIGTAPAIGVLALILLLGLVMDRFVSRPAATNPGRAELPPNTPIYWVLMLIAGTLGTVIGDFSSFRSGLGLAGASLTLSLIVLAVLGIGSRGLLAIAVFYWLAIVTVRAAGTSVGDLFAKLIGLTPSTIVAAIVLVGVLSLWKESGTQFDRSK